MLPVKVEVQLVVNNRKNRFPAGGVMVTKLFVPSLEMLSLGTGVQLVVVKSEFCCKVQPVDGLFQ